MLTHSFWLFSAQKRWQRKLIKSRPIHLSQRQQSAQLTPDIWQFKWRSRREELATMGRYFNMPLKMKPGLLKTTLRNLFKLDYDKFYVWVINDCSTDNTEEILQSLTA